MLPARGRPAQTMALEVERALTARDIYDLATGALVPQTTGAPVIQRIKAAHHRIAQLLVTGLADNEVAFATGYSPQRVTDLKNQDPAFQELLAYYQNQVNDLGILDARRIQTKAQDIAENALDEIRERLDDDKTRAQIPLSELRQLSTMGMDRTVAPPKTAQPTTNIPIKITYKIGTKDIRPIETIEATAVEVVENRDED